MGEYLTPQEAHEVSLPLRPFKRRAQLIEYITAMGIPSFRAGSAFMLGRRDLVNAASERQRIDDDTAVLRQQMAEQSQEFNNKSKEPSWQRFLNTEQM